MLSHFDADPAPPHFMGNSGGGARAKEGVEDEVAGVGRDMEDTLDKTLVDWNCSRW